MAVLGTGKRRLVTVAIVLACVAIFGWEWAAAPRVTAAPQVRRELTQVHGRLYLGVQFEGLPLRTVRPFLYSDCLPGKAHVVSCTWVKVDRGRVTGSNARQVARAQSELRPVG